MNKKCSNREIISASLYAKIVILGEILLLRKISWKYFHKIFKIFLSTWNLEILENLKFQIKLIVDKHSDRKTLFWAIKKPFSSFLSSCHPSFANKFDYFVSCSTHTREGDRFIYCIIEGKHGRGKVKRANPFHFIIFHVSSLFLFRQLMFI